MPLLTVEPASGGAVAELRADSLCWDNADAVRDQLLSLADEHGWGRLHLDVSQLRRLTAAGIGALASLHQQFRARGVEFVVRNPRTEVVEVLSVTGLAAVMALE